jgi:hypothetical protein
MVAAAPLNDSLDDILNKAVERTATRVLLAAANSLVPPKKFITNVEAAARIGVTPDTLSVWRSQGEGPQHVGSGKLVRYAVTAVDDWLAALPTAASKGAVAA